MRIPLRPAHNGRADQGIGRGFEIVARRDNVNSMVNGERLDVRIVTSTAADCYALGYSEAEFRRLKFQGEYLRDFTANVLRHAGIAPGMRPQFGDGRVLNSGRPSGWIPERRYPSICLRGSSCQRQAWISASRNWV
jgi:hypothetical protein